MTGSRACLLAWLVVGAPRVAGADDAQAPPPDQRVEELSESVEGLAELAAEVGAGGTSRELDQLSRDLAASAVYVELAERLAAANTPTGAGWHLGVSAGGGVEDRGDRRAAGDLTLSAGATVVGSSCPILDGAAQVSLLRPGGLSAAQTARLCVRGFRPSQEEMDEDAEDGSSIPAEEMELLALTAFESVGWNVRPSVAAAAVMDSSRYATAEAGLSLEGMRWHYRPTRSWALGWVSMAQGYLGQEIGDDWRSLHHLTAAAWFAEWRLDRPAAAVTDGVVQILPLGVDIVESGDALGTFSMSAVSIDGLGTYGVYLDGAIGFAVTTDEEGEGDAPPPPDPTRPGALTGTWRLGLTIGRSTLHGRAGVRRVLLPTLTGAVVIEDRQAAGIHGDVGAVYLDAEAYRAHGAFYIDGDDPADVEHDSWGADGSAWVRLGAHLRVGASLEVGRSFVFADPADAPGAPPEPAFGVIGLLRAAWTEVRFASAAD
ncbi:MAG TPA: hypothetical protein VMZ28_10940 [Kofleriaceae bacterium]|nr:hypothetical protein [Kofleriaceae bacterium]